MENPWRRESTFIEFAELCDRACPARYEDVGVDRDLKSEFAAEHSSRPPLTKVSEASRNTPMAVADINKWISGETEDFFLPNKTLSVTVDRNPGKEGSTASPARQKFVFRAITAVVATFALVALASFVIPMRHPVDPASEADAKPQPSESGPASTGAQAAGDVARSTPVAPVPKEITPAVATILNQPTTVPAPQVAALLRDLGNWYDQRTKAPSIPERKPSPPQQTSRRHGPRDSGQAQAASGEATRPDGRRVTAERGRYRTAPRHEHPE